MVRHLVATAAIPVQSPKAAFLEVVQTRGSIAEFSAQVHAALVDRDGGVRRCWGSPHSDIPLRSLQKLLVVALAVKLGVRALLPDDPEALSTACGTHRPEPRVVVRVQHYLRLAEQTRAALRCGGPPTGGSSTHGPCAANHAFVLLLCKRMGWTADYDDPHHPVWIEVRRLLAVLLGKSETAIPIVTDNCMIPSFVLTVVEVARVWRAFEEPTSIPEDWRPAFAAVGEAIRAAPQGIGWTDGLDVSLARIGFVAKYAASGVRAIASPYGALVVRVDTPDLHALDAATLHVLGAVGWIANGDLESLRAFANPPVLSATGIVVGRYEVRHGGGRQE